MLMTNWRHAQEFWVWCYFQQLCVWGVNINHSSSSSKSSSWCLYSRWSRLSTKMVWIIFPSASMLLSGPLSHWLWAWPVTCFSQWDIGTCDGSRGLKSNCAPGFVLLLLLRTMRPQPCEQAQLPSHRTGKQSHPGLPSPSHGGPDLETCHNSNHEK